MEALDQHKVLERLCKLSGKFGMFISIYWPEDKPELVLEVSQASFLKDIEHSQIICDKIGYFLFDTEEEMEDYYRLCVGPDGPHDFNEYGGEVCVYALTCSNKGETLSENT